MFKMTHKKNYHIEIILQILKCGFWILIMCFMYCGTYIMYRCCVCFILIDCTLFLMVKSDYIIQYSGLVRVLQIEYDVK